MMKHLVKIKHVFSNQYSLMRDEILYVNEHYKVVMFIPLERQNVK